MSHCAPEATLKPKCFEFMLKTVITDVTVVQGTWRLFQRRGPAAAKLLSPNVLCVHGTAHDLSVDERSRHLGPSETKCMSSAKCGGAWPDKDE